MAEVGRRSPGERVGRAWSVSALVGATTARPGSAPAPRRPAPRGGSCASRARPCSPAGWPNTCGWSGSPRSRTGCSWRARERRRFLDRLVFAAEPPHAARASAYEKALRERARLLAEPPADPAWLSALEARMAESGALVAAARARTLAALQAEIDDRAGRPFPQGNLALTGEWEALAGQGVPVEEIETRLAAALAKSRDRDAAAGRALTGPHRGDLAVDHREKDRPASECSTGEQKALILNLVLAQAARLSREKAEPNPILLLDEVAAHLDQVRRAGLFDELEALGLQAFLTGVDEALFSDLSGRALGVRVDAGALYPTD